MTLMGELVRDKKNRHDLNGVTVLVEGRQVGYLSRAEAPAVAPVMDRDGVNRIGGGGVPRTVLADRMGRLKAGVVADVVMPTAEYGGSRRTTCVSHL
jgi:hypothetical protein